MVRARAGRPGRSQQVAARPARPPGAGRPPPSLRCRRPAPSRRPGAPPTMRRPASSTSARAPRRRSAPCTAALSAAMRRMRGVSSIEPSRGGCGRSGGSEATDGIVERDLEHRRRHARPGGMPHGTGRRRCDLAFAAAAVAVEHVAARALAGRAGRGERHVERQHAARRRLARPTAGSRRSGCRAASGRLRSPAAAAAQEGEGQGLPAVALRLGQALVVALRAARRPPGSRRRSADPGRLPPRRGRRRPDGASWPAADRRA